MKLTLCQRAVLCDACVVVLEFCKSRWRAKQLVKAVSALHICTSHNDDDKCVCALKWVVNFNADLWINRTLLWSAI